MNADLLAAIQDALRQMAQAEKDAENEQLLHLIEQIQTLPTDLQVQIIAALLQPFTPWGKYHRYAPVWEAADFHVIPKMYYSPMPDVDELSDDLWAVPSSMAGVDTNDAQQLEMLETIIPQYISELAILPDAPPGDDVTFYWDNPMYTNGDAILLHTMVRHFKPKQILEIGSGFSTLISTRAANMNGHTEVLAIEPYPPEFLQKLPSLERLIVEPIQQVSLTLFEALGEDDILFIDTSHVIRTGGDVNYIYLEILPRLKGGVLVHIHDIFLPNEYPKVWVIKERRAWNEQYLLQAMLMNSTKFEIMYGIAYMRQHYPQRTQALGDFGTKLMHGGSIWLRTRR